MDATAPRRSAAQRIADAADTARGFATLARARAADPAYAGAVDALNAIAGHMDTVAAALAQETPIVFDGVEVTNCYPAEMVFALYDVEEIAAGADTGFAVDFTREITAAFNR